MIFSLNPRPSKNIFSSAHSVLQFIMQLGGSRSLSAATALSLSFLVTTFSPTILMAPLPHVRTYVRMESLERLMIIILKLAGPLGENWLSLILSWGAMQLTNYIASYSYIKLYGPAIASMIGHSFNTKKNNQLNDASCREVMKQRDLKMREN